MSMVAILLVGITIGVGSDDLEWPVTWVSRTLYTYKSNISKPVRL